MEAREKNRIALGPRILIFNKAFFALSETFIYRQVKTLGEEFEVELLGFELKNTEHFDLNSFRFYRISRHFGLVESAIRKLLRIVGVRVRYPRKMRHFLSQYFKRYPNCIVHAHYGWNALYLLPFLKTRNIPLVVSFHGNDASGALRNSEYSKQLPELFDYASHIIVCSGHMIGTLGLRNYSNKVSVVPYGVDVDEFKPQPLESRKDSLVILHSGRLTPKKGVPDLIRVFSRLRARHPNLSLVILGTGVEEESCKALVAELNITESVTFLGAQPQAVVKHFMNSCDIFVLNSRTDLDGDMEGLPNSILEAMAFEKPIVSTRHAGIPTALVDQESGILVNEYDCDGLLDALENLVIDEGRRKSLAKEARIRVVKNFSFQKMKRSLRSIFSAIS